MRDKKHAEATIESNLSMLRAALRWAESMRLIPKAPTIKRLKRAKGARVMKGRPITGEEFDRLIDRAVDVVGQQAAPSWQHYLRGLWLSGLRLEESLQLYWDRRDRLCVDLEGKRPMLRIPAELEKGNRDRLLPMAPEFAEFLLATPEAERTGRVFRPMPRRNDGYEQMKGDSVGRVVCRIGKLACIVVNREVSGKVKYASAHDLRRSFGQRWSTRVMPAVLQQLMRHENIGTTMTFYVGRDAEGTAEILWQAHGTAKNNTSDNTPTVADVLDDENTQENRAFSARPR